MAVAKAQEFQSDIFTQKDVSVDSSSVAVHYVNEDDGPPPTLRIAREAVQLVIKRNLSEIWIACAFPHLWRCIRDLEDAIKEVETEI